MRAVMYHYVRPGPERPPFQYYYLDLDDFRAQLDHLQENYELISRNEFLSIVSGETTPPDGATILTFDDGLLDHYEWVLPELQTRDLWGLFFVPGPITDVLLSVHRIHLLLGVASPAELVSALQDIVDEETLIDDCTDESDRVYEESGDAMATFKRVLNYGLPYDRLPEVLDALEHEFPDAASVTPADYYMNREQVRELSEAGMLLGGHTVTHPVLSRLEPDAQQNEIETSIDFVDDITAEQPIGCFAYPYGTAETFDDATLDALRAQDCDIAFTTESDEIAPSAFREAPLTLPRRDCNEFPHGSASQY